MNDQLAEKALQEMLDIGIREFCICPAGRNFPFIQILKNTPEIKTHYWHEERSAAFFALGRIRALKAPVAVIVTSGTAVGELVPAAMEAYYSSLPLLLVSADRPRRYRFSGAPQTAEQVKLFGRFAQYSIDIEGAETCDLKKWSQRYACHLNVCFEEPKASNATYSLQIRSAKPLKKEFASGEPLDRFLDSVKRPLVIVSALNEEAKEPVQQFLLKLNAPAYLEGISLLREDPKLQPLRIHNPDITTGLCDSVLRIGGVPTHRAWRDLEDNHLPVFSISETPFSGLSYANVTTGDLEAFFKNYELKKTFSFFEQSEWREKDLQFKEALEELFLKEPSSEPSLFRELSSHIEEGAHVFLGNSMPIRNWDLAAENQPKQWLVTATRGLNGIDGQLSTFFGLCHPQKSNWAIIGDLTALYDMSSFWILDKLEAQRIRIVVVNNFGGKIFARKFPKDIEVQNNHSIQFEALAKMWRLPYERWSIVPEYVKLEEKAFIELNSDFEATERFWQSYRDIKKGACSYFG